jgi:hypothetical protein
MAALCTKPVFTGLLFTTMLMWMTNPCEVTWFFVYVVTDFPICVFFRRFSLRFGIATASTERHSEPIGSDHSLPLEVFTDFVDTTSALL